MCDTITKSILYITMSLSSDTSKSLPCSALLYGIAISWCTEGVSNYSIISNKKNGRMLSHLIVGLYLFKTLLSAHRWLRNTREALQWYLQCEGRHWIWSGFSSSFSARHKPQLIKVNQTHQSTENVGMNSQVAPIGYLGVHVRSYYYDPSSHSWGNYFTFSLAKLWT